jgi:diguanylate cyclase (GGDEF)-like protein
LLLLCFCGFIVYAAQARSKFFVLVLAALIFMIGLLLFFRQRILRSWAEQGIHEQDFLEQANLLESDIEKEWKAVQAIQKKMIDYGQLKGIAEELNESFTLHETSKTLSTEVSRLFGQKDVTVILYLFHSKTGELGISASQKGQMAVNLKAKKGDIYDHWVAKNMQALLIEDARNDFRFDLEKVYTEDSRAVQSLMSVPMTIGTKAIGILRLDSPKQNYFHAENIRLLTTIADLGAVAIENAQLYERIEDLAIRDSLTGLFLRRHFLSRLTHELNRELRQEKTLAFLMIDLDHFKKYNDKYGHMAGDIVLKTLALMLTEIFHEPGSMICRYGGEEFALFIPDCSKERALELAEDLRKKVESQAIILRREKTKVSVSVGVAVFPQDAHLKDDLIEKADMALYQAKKKGRNRACTA